MKKCVEIRRTGIGDNGQIVLFNRSSGKKVDKKLAVLEPPTVERPELVESLKALGITVTSESVAAAIEVVFPGGIEGTDQGEVVRKVFLHLQGRKPY